MRRTPTLILAAWLLALALFQPFSAFGQTASTRPATIDVLPEPIPPTPPLWRKYVSQETVVHGAGALIGIIAFNFYVAPLAVASGVGAGPVRSLLSTRVMATTLAATGAVLTTYVYDRWTDQPIDTIYLWSRAGAVAGVAAGTGLLAGLGYPPSIALARFSPEWVANRSFLVGSALLGAWMTEVWMRRRQTDQPP